MTRFFDTPCRSYKHFNNCDFRYALSIALCNQGNIGYDDFETIFMNTLNMHAPIKRKVIRANEAPFMNREIKIPWKEHV